MIIAAHPIVIMLVIAAFTVEMTKETLMDSNDIQPGDDSPDAETIVNTFVSGGRNPNWQPTCRTCSHLVMRHGGAGGGWCSLPANRSNPNVYWPNGYMPSVSPTGGCGYHSDS